MDPILLQKQLKDNTEEINKCIDELNLFTNEMKRKEINRYGVDGFEDKAGSVIEEKSSKKSKDLKNTENIEQEKRISSFDYSAWEKYDVEEACKQLEEERKIKNIEEALYAKEMGNSYFTKWDFDKAMEWYNRAIDQDDTNPIFYGNRAQCYLKLEKWHDVIEDCDRALKLDKEFVKAYLRRASAFEKLKNYDGAMNDLNRVMTLEPKNSQAKAGLDKIKNTLKKFEAENKDKFILAISKAPHLRSKQALKRIAVSEVSGDSSCVTATSPIIDIPVTPVIDTPKPFVKQNPAIKNKIENVLEKVGHNDKIHSIPTNCVQFVTAWNQLKPNLRYQYLKQLKGRDIPNIFGESLESPLLSEIIEVLYQEAGDDDDVIDYLEGFVKTPRFSTLVLFLSSADKQCVQKLLSKCLSKNKCTTDQYHMLENAFELMF